MLEVKNLSFYYKEKERKYSYSFNVEKSEVVAIMGKSGSGKSTLLDILAGFLEPTDGEALLDGNNFLLYPAGKRPVTILFQNYNLFEYLSVEQNIAVGIDGSFLLNPNKRDIVTKTLQEVELQGFEKRIVSSLSGGEQQRVAIARTIVRDKPVLLLDEPFGALDLQTKTDMLKLIEKVTIEKNLHTVMVTHDQYECDLIAKSVYVLENYSLKKK